MSYTHQGAQKQSGSQNQSGTQSFNQTTTPGFAPGQEDFINQLAGIFGNAGVGSPWESGFQGVSSEDANNIAGESVRIAKAGLPQIGVENSGVGQVAMSRVAGDVLRNVAQSNAALKQTGFMGLSSLMGGQLQGLQPYTQTGTGSFSSTGNMTGRTSGSSSWKI